MEKMKTTYADLLDTLRTAMTGQQAQDVTVDVPMVDEFYPVEEAVINEVVIHVNGEKDIEPLPDFLSEGRLYLKVA